VLLNFGALLAAVLLAAIFLLPGRLPFKRKLGHRRALSVAAGASVAYIFVKLLPELEEIASLFHHETKYFLPYEGVYGINIAMLLGFLFFYGLDEMSLGQAEDEGKNRDKMVYWTQVLGYGGYVGLIGYLLVRSLMEEEVSRLFYVLSMSMHFFMIGFGLRDMHKESYDLIDRYVLAAFCLSGWLIGTMVELPRLFIMILFGFVSGGVISVTGIVELPRDKEGKFVPFLIGALVYAVFLINFQ